jgi:hypothetical protein
VLGGLIRFVRVTSFHQQHAALWNSIDRSLTFSQLCGVALGLIIVGYIQFLKSSHKSENRNTEVGETSRSLKILANDLKVPVLELSQLSRDIEKRVGANKEPQVSDLRDSGILLKDSRTCEAVLPYGGIFYADEYRTTSRIYYYPQHSFEIK